MSNSVFPSLPGLKWDVLKSPRWSTNVQQSVGGKEIRASYYTRPLYTWLLTYELLRASALLELQSLIGFFNARQGKFDSFLYSDPTDNSVTAHGFGVGDNVTTAFQLQRSLAGPRTQDWQGVQAMYTTPRTNYLLFSEQLDNAAWTKAGSTIGANFALAPDGTVTADKIQEDTSTGNHAVTQAVVGANGQWTFTAWAAAVERSKCVVSMSDGAGGFAMIGVDLTNGSTFAGGLSVGAWTGISSTVTPLATGGYKITITGTRGAGTGTTGQIFIWTTAISYTGTAGSGILAGICQLEFGVAAATAYIKTTTGAVTVTPLYYPQSGDAFEPVFDLVSAPRPQIFINGVLKAEGTDYTIGATGIVTFTAAPALNAALTWSGSYYWRVRFDIDQADFNNFLSQLWEAKQITLVTVK